MATPPVSNEELERTVAAFEAAGRNQSHAADALGISRAGLRDRLKSAAKKGLFGSRAVLPGFVIRQTSEQIGPDGELQRQWIKQAPEAGEPFTVPDGHVVKGVSALTDADGRVMQQWVKTREGIDPATVIDTIKAAFKDYEGRASHVAPPPSPDKNLLNLFPCNDWHVNLLTWEREVGENWDLKIAESVLGRTIEDVIFRSPEADTAVVLGGGDLVHADNNENRTAKSGNALDADGRHQKGLEVACRLKVRTIDAALARNGRVIVRILPGNHDEYSAVAIAYFLLAWYRNEPRVTVDVDPSLFWWFRFGLVMLGATHGHTVKLKDMPSIMAHRRAEDWGATKFRYVHGFHVHHQSKIATEGNGVIAETHQAPVPQDAWHFGAGFLSTRSMQSITYDAERGEIGRVRVAIC